MGNGRGRSRLASAALAGAVLVCTLAAPGARAPRAEELSGETRWLAPGIDAARALANRPRQAIAAGAQTGALADLATLGEIASRAPAILGRNARRAELSCDVCHANGHVNLDFFAAGLSDRPGSFDPTNGRFHATADDGVFNPIDIPSLRGVGATAPYGRDGRFATLRAFTRHVIVDEFGGAEPDPLLLDALVAYQRRLGFLPAPGLLPGGRLAPATPADARRGEAVFRTPPPGRTGPSCADCHRPADGFVDRLRHDVGNGGAFDTPTLRNMAVTPPYFHDGRHATLADVVDHFDGYLGLGLDAGERHDLLAYLTAVGAAPENTEPVTLDRVLVDLRRFDEALERAIAAEDRALAGLVATALRGMLGRLNDRFPSAALGGARDVVVGWAVRLRAVERFAENGQFGPALAALAAYRRHFDATAPRLEAAAPRSLFDPGRLATFLAARATERAGGVAP